MEFEEALQGYKGSGKPDILAFRNMSPAQIATVDPDARRRDVAQLDALDAFWKLHFADKTTFIGGHETYKTVEEFEARLEPKLRKLIERRIASSSANVAGLATPIRGVPIAGFAPMSSQTPACISAAMDWSPAPSSGSRRAGAQA